jgi:hypothetical protein
MIRDPRDRTMPAGGQFLMEDPLSGERLYVDAKQYKRRYDEAARQQEIDVHRVFEAAKAGLVIIDTGQPDLIHPIVSFLKHRSAVLKT